MIKLEIAQFLPVIRMRNEVRNIALITIFFAIFLLFQGCNEDNPPSCDCDKTEFVLNFSGIEGKIYYVEDTVNSSWNGWVISVNSADNSQVLVGKICNLNSIKEIINIIPSKPFEETPITFSGRVTRLCPDLPSPTAPANISFFYIKVETIKL